MLSVWPLWLECNVTDLLFPELYGLLRWDGQCCGLEACSRQTKINWTKTASHTPGYTSALCWYTHTHAHTHTHLYGYGLSIGPTDGLSLWWLKLLINSHHVQDNSNTHYELMGNFITPASNKSPCEWQFQDSRNMNASWCKLYCVIIYISVEDSGYQM